MNNKSNPSTPPPNGEEASASKPERNHPNTGEEALASNEELIDNEKHKIEESASHYQLSTLNSPLIKEGYKQTEVGVIPEDWEMDKLVNLAPIATGNTPPTVNKSNYGREYLFVSPADLGDKKYIKSTIKMLSKKGFEISRQYPVNSILFTCIGSTIGKCGIATSILTSNQQINSIFPSDEIAHEFLYYQLLRIAPFIKLSAGEQAVPIVNKSQFGENTIIFPSDKSEQKAIAKALSDVDALIDAQEKLIAKKQAIKTATMQQLLTGKKRLGSMDNGEWIIDNENNPNDTLPQTQTTNPPYKFKKTELGEIPEDWEVGKVIDVAPFQRGFDLPNIMLRKGKYPVGYSNGIQKYHSEYMVKGPGVFTGRSGTIGRVHFVEKNYWPHNTCLWVTDFKGNNERYIFYLYSSMHIERFSSGSGVPTLNRNDVHDHLVCFPKPEEQKAIAKVLSDMDSEIEALQAKLQKSKFIKQGMMQELLTGKTRLIDN